MERTLVELVSAVRRAGVRVSTAEVIDAGRAFAACGVQDRATLRSALASTLAKSPDDHARFGRAFDAFFEASGRTHDDLYARLRARGFSAEEVSALREVLEATARAASAEPVFSALVGGSLAMDHLLELSARRGDLPRIEDPARAGFLTMRLLEAAKVPRAEASLSALRSRLRDALGARGAELADAVSDELSRLRRRAREHVLSGLSRSDGPRDALRVPFSQLDPHEQRAVEREVARLAERLVGRALVRAKRARHGRIDARRTLRAGLRTDGVPFRVVQRGRAPRRQKLVVLCDISDSVRHSARFMLLFVQAVQRLFVGCRSFVFVSDVGETTQLFREQAPARAIELAYGGAAVSVSDNSHYAHAFSRFERRHADALDARTTLVIIGDARTNHFDAGERVLARLAQRAGRVVWLNPEPEGAWSTGDSAMARFGPQLDLALPVYDVATLRAAGRALSNLRTSLR